MRQSAMQSPLFFRLAGALCIISILWPLVMILTVPPQGLEEILRLEKRQPKPLELPTLSEMLDTSVWIGIVEALRDRIPWRHSITTTIRGLERDYLHRTMFPQVVTATDNWMFYKPSIDTIPVSPESLKRAVETLNGITSADNARFFFIPAPDKVSIYPERLISYRWKYEEQQEQRRRLQAVFESGNHPELIGTWSRMLHQKSVLDEPLYTRTDTHYTHRGALIVAEALIDGIQLGTWDQDAIVYKERPPRSRDLTSLAGLEGIKEPFTSLSTVRPGVNMHSCRRENKPTDCQQIFDVVRIPLRIRNKADPDTPIIRGKTLLIHDSFIESFLKQTLSPYFEDISFVQYRFIENGDIPSAMAHYDQLIIERVERQIGGVVNNILNDVNNVNKDMIGIRLGLEGV